MNYGSYEYLCLVPTANYTMLLEDEFLKSDPLLSLNDTELKLLREEERSLVSTKLISLQDKLAEENACVLYVSGYWAYKFCFNREFSQYHFVKDGSVKDPNGPAYILGTDSKKKRADDFELITSDVLEGDDGSYVSQLIGDGSICDITRKPRSTFVRYKCGRGITKPVIESVSEWKTCQYLVVILLPELCEFEMFQPKQRHVYDLPCQLVEQGGKVTPKTSVVEYQMIPLGFNIFLGATKAKKSNLTVMFSNRIGAFDKELVRESIKLAFANAINTAQFKIPGYIVRAFVENLESAALFSMRPDPGLITLKDTFIYVTKLYDWNGVFIDNVEIVFNGEEGSSVTFGLEQFEEDSDADYEWYGTSVTPDEYLLGNFIAFNGIRFQGTIA